MKTDDDFSPVIIKCPECQIIQAAIIEHTIPFATYIHQCVACNYVITEQLWDEVKWDDEKYKLVQTKRNL